MEMKKKVKSAKSITPGDKPPKRPYQAKWRQAKEAAGDYTNQNGLGKERILELGKAFLFWAQEELENPFSNRLVAAKFWLINDIHYTVPAELWCTKYPEFKRDYDLAIALIGVKRETSMMKRELSEKSTMFTMHNYLSYWDKANKYHAALKESPDESKGKAVYKLVEMSDV